MEDILKSAVILSILSTPSKLGLWDSTHLSPGEILKKLSPDELKIQEIIGHRYSWNADKASDLILERCIRQKVKIITIWDDEYPHLLKEIHNPPMVLYSAGEITGKRMISVVGTRDSDEKSQDITKKISGRISQAGYTIVSGMALGIDRSAHLGALTAGGATVAVLPGGVDIIYPPKNIDIYRMISESKLSAVISEYPPGTGTAQKWTFAKRNRIISGMSEAVIVIQAPLKSGAMITARYAIEQNRDLFACPGNAFDDKYSGCNELIRQGAAIFSEMNDFFTENNSENESVEFPVTGGQDVIIPEKKVNRIENEVKVKIEVTGRAGIKIYEELKNGPIEVDQFIRINNFSVDEVNQGITLLEIEGYLERKGNRIYKL